MAYCSPFEVRRSTSGTRQPGVRQHHTSRPPRATPSVAPRRRSCSSSAPSRTVMSHKLSAGCYVPCRAVGDPQTGVRHHLRGPDPRPHQSRTERQRLRRACSSAAGHFTRRRCDDPNTSDEFIERPDHNDYAADHVSADASAADLSSIVEAAGHLNDPDSSDYIIVQSRSQHRAHQLHTQLIDHIEFDLLELRRCFEDRIREDFQGRFLINAPFKTAKNLLLQYARERNLWVDVCPDDNLLKLRRRQTRAQRQVELSPRDPLAPSGPLAPAQHTHVQRRTRTPSRSPQPAHRREVRRRSRQRSRQRSRPRSLSPLARRAARGPTPARAHRPQPQPQPRPRRTSASAIVGAIPRNIVGHSSQVLLNRTAASMEVDAPSRASSSSRVVGSARPQGQIRQASTSAHARMHPHLRAPPQPQPPPATARTHLVARRSRARPALTPRPPPGQVRRRAGPMCLPPRPRRPIARGFSLPAHCPGHQSPSASSLPPPR